MLRFRSCASGTSRLGTGLLLAVGGTVAVGSSPALAQQRVEITGSAIKRTDVETPAPVEIVTREEIRRTGATTINELLKSISVIDIADAGELSSNSPGGSGTARIRLRGLGDTQTLTLINGRRVPVNPLADASGAGAAFNVNQIPVGAIERIEILKDGGSAIYGADAVAGVVNFILRKDYQGINLQATAGQSSRGDAPEHQLGLTAGFGDLSKDRFNILGSLDVFKRDPYLRKDREISASVDFRRYGAIPGFNLDGRSAFAPQGNILDANGVPTGQTVQPCPPADFTNNACRYDFNAGLLTAYNGADRLSGLLAGTLAVTNDISAFARYIRAEDKDHFEAHPVPDNFILPDGRRYAGRFMQGGPRITDKTTTFDNFELGAEGSIGALDWKAGLSRGKAESVNSDQNYYNRTAWNAALQGGLIDATVTSNDPAVVQSLKISPVRTASSKLDLFDAQIAGDLFRLPGGTSRWALGVNGWKETLEDNPDPLQVAGQVVGSIQQSAVSAARNAKALFAELQLPITRAIEAQLAARYDQYDTAKRVSPKVALKWQALPELLLRASYSGSFKMPTLKQLYANAGQGAINLTESQCTGVGLPAGCAGTPAFRLTGSNPGLQPELGTNVNIGFVADVGALSFSADFWQIDKQDNITTPTLDTAIQQGFFAFDPATARWFVFQNLQNFSQAKNQGVDIDGRLRFKGTPLGNVTLRGTATYYTHQATRTTSTSPWAEFNGTYLTPRWRSAVSATAETGPWIVQGLARATGGFWDTIQPLQNFGVLPAGGLRRVETYEEIDLSISYAGIKNLTLTGAIKNLFDRMPPFSATNATNNNFSQQGFAELYNARGRYFQISAAYQF